MEKKMTSVIVLLLLILSTLWGCAASQPTGEPLLPPGFKEARLPNTDLLAYAYVSQTEPTQVSEKLLDLPQDGNVISLSAWASPSGKDAGIGVRFINPTEAEIAYQFIPEKDNRWKKLSGQEVFLVQGAGEGFTPMKEAISSGDWTTLETRYPDVWQVMKRLPSQPTGKPVAAGFVTLDENLFKTLADAMENEEIKNALPALSMARLDYLAFAAYSDKPLKLPEEIKLSDLKESGLRAILVGRAGYPSFLLDLLFGNIVQRFGLEEVSFEAGKAYHIAQGDLHLAAKNNGNHIYVVAATSKEKALELLTSAFK